MVHVRLFLILVIAMLTVAAVATFAQSFGWGIAVFTFLVGIIGEMFLTVTCNAMHQN